MKVVSARKRIEAINSEIIESEEAKEIVHVGFEIGLLFKAIHGLVQLVGGVLMLFLTPSRLCDITQFLTRHQLSKDPIPRFANFLMTLSDSFSIGTQHFALFYLFSHGIIRFVLVFLLWRKKLWAYPLTAVFLMFFIACQVYRYMRTGSMILLLFTVCDSVMVVLTLLEYRNLRTASV